MAKCPRVFGSFFEAAISEPPHEYRGPEWTGTLRRDQLVVIANRLLPDLQPAEVHRIFDSVEHNASGNVDLRSFGKAAISGTAQFVLSSIVERFSKLHAHEFTVPGNFDYSKSTSDNYKCESGAFTDKYSMFRANMDYSYHVNYTLARQNWQDQVIDSIIVRSTPQAKPWLVYTCGPMGVGKGYALSWMSQHGYFPLENIVHVDPDAFKTMMPEWANYVAYNGDNAGTKCHMESCYMMEIAQAAAMKQHQNIWIDGSLRNAAFYSEQFQSIRERFPHYRIAIFYVDASERTIRERIKERADKTGRNVPEHLIQASLQAMDRSLNQLTPLCDFVARINNEGLQPALRAFEAIDATGIWAVIKDKFAKGADESTTFPHALPPMTLEPMSKEFISQMTVSGDKHVMTVKLAGSSQVLNKLVVMLGDHLELPASYEHVVTLPNMAREKLSIPSDASTFFWIYAPRDYAGKRLDKAVLVAHGFTAEDQQRDVIHFLRKGGFCYLNKNGEVVGVRTSASSKPDTAQALQFDCAVTVPDEIIKHLPMARFYEVGSILFRSRNAESYAWYPPGEKVQGFSLGGEHGAFVYVLKDECGVRSAVTFPVTS